jgi:hypothetical protein
MPWVCNSGYGINDCEVGLNLNAEYFTGVSTSHNVFGRAIVVSFQPRWVFFQPRIVLPARRCTCVCDRQATISLSLIPSMAFDPRRAWRLAPRLLAFPPSDARQCLGQDHGERGCRGRAKTSFCLYRWHGCAGASEGCCNATEQTDNMSRRFNRKTGGDTQALGRARRDLAARLLAFAMRQADSSTSCWRLATRPNLHLDRHLLVLTPCQMSAQAVSFFPADGGRRP